MKSLPQLSISLISGYITEYSIKSSMIVVLKTDTCDKEANNTYNHCFKFYVWNFSQVILIRCH